MNDDFPRATNPQHRHTPTKIARELGVHVSTVWRWISDGVLVSGRRVRLRALRVGGRAFITQDALDQFLKRLNSREDATGGDRDAADIRCEKFGL